MATGKYQASLRGKILRIIVRQYVYICPKCGARITKIIGRYSLTPREIRCMMPITGGICDGLAEMEV